MIAIFGYRPKLLRKTLGYISPIGSGSTPSQQQPNPLVKGDHPGWHWMHYSRVQLIICVWSLQNKALLQKPTGNNKLADSAANVCPPLLVLTAAEWQLTICVFCLSSRAASQTNLNPPKLANSGIGWCVSFSGAPYVIVCGSYICTFPFIWCSLAS
jgi:hypothetical protein